MVAQSLGRLPSCRIAVIAVGALVAAVGCGAVSSARILDGSSYVGTAENAMAADGVLFAPFELAISESGDGDQFRCIDTVNHAAADALAKRYQVKTVEPYAAQRHGVPTWAHGTGGRVAVHIESVRCGLVVGDPTYAMAASDDPGGADESRSVVVLSVVDRTTGSVVVRIRGEAKDSDSFAAARAAAERAAQVLMPIQ